MQCASMVLSQNKFLLTVLGQCDSIHRPAWPYKPSVTVEGKCSVNQGPVSSVAVLLSKGFCGLCFESKFKHTKEQRV